MLQCMQMTDMQIIGIDLGGTKCAAARYDAQTFKRLEHFVVPTRTNEGFHTILGDMLQCIERLRTPQTRLLGIGMPGLVRERDGIIHHMPNIPGGEGYPLKEYLEKQTGLRVTIGNDSQTFALAEALEGAGKGKRVVVGITMGTGVGGGIVIDGKLFTGSDGFAGEIGHTLLMPGSPPYDTPDCRGEVEQFLSGTAMRKRCTDAKRPEDLLAGEACAFLHPSIVRETAWLCTNLTYMLNPTIIVFGGSTGRALLPYLPGIREELSRWMLKDTPLPGLAIRQLEDAATRGAALLAREG